MENTREFKDQLETFIQLLMLSSLDVFTHFFTFPDELAPVSLCTWPVPPHLLSSDPLPPFLLSHNGMIPVFLACDWLYGVAIKVKSHPCLHGFSVGLKIQLPHIDGPLITDI